MAHSSTVQTLGFLLLAAILLQTVAVAVTFMYFSSALATMKETFSKSSISCLRRSSLNFLKGSEADTKEDDDDPCWQVTEQLHLLIEKTMSTRYRKELSSFVSDEVSRVLPSIMVESQHIKRPELAAHLTGNVINKQEKYENSLSRGVVGQKILNWESKRGLAFLHNLHFKDGTAGNLMTILIVSKYKDMRTTTNLYLSSMAFSDLFIFLCLPLDLYRIWRYRPWNFGDLLCKLFQFVSESCTYSTILNITALSIERYFAICFPLRAKVVVTKGRVKGIILLLWAIAFASAGPIFVLVGVKHEDGTDPWETNECKPTDYAIRSGLLTIMVWVSSIFFFLPVFCLTILYSLIGRKLWKRKRDTIGPNMSSRDKNNKQTVKMLDGDLAWSGRPLEEKTGGVDISPAVPPPAYKRAVPSVYIGAMERELRSSTLRGSVATTRERLDSSGALAFSTTTTAGCRIKEAASFHSGSRSRVEEDGACE
ncbi:GHSR protein, partial [Polypterus senegalus]